jgi:hypothetical protein
VNRNDMEWTRSSYDTTLMNCSGDDLPLQVWYRRMGFLLDGLKGMTEFQIHDNGYVRFRGVLVRSS